MTGACELLLHVATSFRGHFGACMVSTSRESSFITLLLKTLTLYFLIIPFMIPSLLLCLSLCESSLSVTPFSIRYPPPPPTPHFPQVGQLYTTYPEAIHESLLSAQGSLPLQTATYYSTVDVMEYVLDLYPEACLLKAPSENHENLLHVAVDISSSSYACTGNSEDRGSGLIVHEEGMNHSTTDEDYYRACVAGKVVAYLPFFRIVCIPHSRLLHFSSTLFSQY